jgi:type I restriction enzyme R subunit
MAETIENNIRKIIVDEQAVNPKYYEEMSELLDALIEERRQRAIEYQAYLQRVKALAANILQPDGARHSYPPSLDTRAKRALYDNLDNNEELALRIDTAVRHTKKDGWIGHRFKEREVINAIREELSSYQIKLQDVVDLVKNQDEYK